MRFYLIILLIASGIYVQAQEDTRKNFGEDSFVKKQEPEINENKKQIKPEINNIENTKQDYQQAMSFVMQIGAWLPLGYLENTFDVSPAYGLRLGFRMSRNVTMQFGLNLFVPKESSEFDVKINNQTYSTTSQGKANGSIGTWFTHYTLSRNKKVLFEKYIGVGVGFIQLDLVNPLAALDENQYYSMRTVNLNFGFALSSVMRRHSKWGIFVEYNFTPYYTSGFVETSFGSNSISVGLQYSL